MWITFRYLYGADVQSMIKHDQAIGSTSSPSAAIVIADRALRRSNSVSKTGFFLDILLSMVRVTITEAMMYRDAKLRTRLNIVSGPAANMASTWHDQASVRTCIAPSMQCQSERV